MRKIALGGDISSYMLGTSLPMPNTTNSPIGIYKSNSRIGVQTVTKQLIETMEKQIGKIEEAIRKFTKATNDHDMSRRHGGEIIHQDRNRRAGDVYETRQQLESILSTVTEEIEAAKSAMCDDAHDRMHIALSEIVESDNLEWAKARALVALPEHV